MSIDMYGTIFRMRPKAGRGQAIIDLMEQWNKERKGKVKGAIGGYLMKPDTNPNELIGVAIFSDRESYRANAEDPEQHKWFLKIRENLAWEDGEFLTG